MVGRRFRTVAALVAALLVAALPVAPRIAANAATAQQWQLSPPGGTGPALPGDASPGRLSCWEPGSG